jgi:hypothetical protein
MVRFDIAKVESGDIAIKISHNGCTSKVTIWLKKNNGPSGWHMIAQLRQQFHFTITLHRDTNITIVKTREIPRTGNI